MRRRPGIAGLQLDAAARSPYRALGESVQETKAAHVRATLSEFRRRLERFAREHARDIRADPGFRARFHAMCATVGVDPLASAKGAWAELLGIGDWYAALGVAVVEACLASRAVDGGLTDAGRVRAYVARRGFSSSSSSSSAAASSAAAKPSGSAEGGPATITDDDVERAVTALSALGSGFSVVKVGERRLVRSVPGELSDDGGAVLEFAAGERSGNGSGSGSGSAGQQQGGWTTAERVSQGLGWDPERASAALERLLADGIGLVDDQFVEDDEENGGGGGRKKERGGGGGGGQGSPKRAFWFPCLGSSGS